MSVNHSQRFDDWIRGDFVALNTALEELYFAQDNRMAIAGVGDAIKAQLRDEGHDLIVPLLREGKTGDGFANAFALLGSVGLYMGALRRHELTNPDNETVSPFPDASALALHIGISIGMVPRFATAHLATHNLAVNGLRKSFTALPDEFLFIDENCRAILSFQRAADALDRIASLGVTSPVADVLFEDAKGALRNVIAFNARLFDRLDVERFFFCVRPYYKPYRVGWQSYRGANAGDFAGINQLDLMLGLASAADAWYAQLLHEKLPFMMPSEQAKLRDCMARRSLLDDLLDLADAHGKDEWYRTNVSHFLEVCDLFGETAAQHHNQLVSRFIEGPADHVGGATMKGLTASGPPLHVMLKSLETLRDTRCAAKRGDLRTRYDDLARLREIVG